jgi:hypothetical protein
VDLVIGELGVPTVDHQVALGQDLREVLHDGVGDLARGNHHPDDARDRQRCDQFVQAGHIGAFGIAVETGDLDPVPAESLPHVESHFSESNEADMHELLFLTRCPAVGCGCRMVYLPDDYWLGSRTGINRYL